MCCSILNLRNERVAWCVLFIDMFLLRESKDPKGTQEEQGTKLGEGCHRRGCLVQNGSKIEQWGPLCYPENLCNKIHDDIQKKRSYKSAIFVVNKRGSGKTCCGPSCSPQESKPDKEKDVQVWFCPVEVPKGPIGIYPGKARSYPPFTRTDRYRRQSSPVEDIDNTIPDKQRKGCADPACQQIGNILGSTISAERRS